MWLKLRTISLILERLYLRYYWKEYNNLKTLKLFLTKKLKYVNAQLQEKITVMLFLNGYFTRL